MQIIQEMFQKATVILQSATDGLRRCMYNMQQMYHKVIVQCAADVSEGNCIICRGWNQMIVQRISEGNFTHYPAGGIRKWFYFCSVQQIVPDGDFILYSTYIRWLFGVQGMVWWILYCVDWYKWLRPYSQLNITRMVMLSEWKKTCPKFRIA